MARSLVDLDSLDLSKTVLDRQQLDEFLPQRHEFEMLDGVCHLDTEEGLIVAYKDVGGQPWWGRGHIPGRPLLPGVLMIEGCAQAAVVLIKNVVDWPLDGFIGLGGLENVRFRGTVEPGQRVYFVSRKGTVSGRRMARYPAQAFCNGKMICQLEVLGVLL